MARSSSLRASDTDRDAVVERLRLAAAEGRLEPEELEDRVHAALRARTYGDLNRLLADLPAGLPARRRRDAVAPVAVTALAVTARVAVALAVFALMLTIAAVRAAWWIARAVARSHGWRERTHGLPPYRERGPRLPAVAPPSGRVG
jgi:Domain of unknown function (DUF1707)